MPRHFYPARYRAQGLSDAPAEVSLPGQDASVNATPDNINGDLAAYKSKAAVIKYWKNVLTSRNNTTPAGSRPPGSKTGQATALWLSGIGSDAADSIDDVIFQLTAMLGFVGGGDTTTSQMMGDLSAAESTVGLKYDQAVAQAEQINSLFDDDVAQVAQGVTAGDVANAAISSIPVVAAVEYATDTATPEAAVGVIGRVPARIYATAAADANAAAQSIGKFASAAVPVVGKWLEYGAIGLGALAVLYVSGMIKPLLPNPPRRRRRRA